MCQRHRNEAAENHHVALAKVLDVHHAPDEGETVGRERKGRPDEKAVQQELNVQDGGLRKQ